MELGDSRSTSLKEQMKSTRGSFFVKATGRDTKPAWGNRIVKDFNDLDYDVERNRFSNISKFKNTELVRKEKLQADLRKRRNSRRTIGQKDSQTTKGRSVSRQGRNMSLSVALPRSQRIELGTLHSPEAQKYGLSPFEYENTIEGKIKLKSYHHLSFEKNKIERIVNEYPIHYNRHEDIDFSFSQLMSVRKHLKKYHQFASYPDRKVFLPKDELDKFYDEDHSRKLASPRRNREAVLQFQRVTGRKEPKYNESVALAFDTVPCIEKTQKRSESYSIPNTSRETVFSPQIIDQKRGCYR